MGTYTGNDVLLLMGSEGDWEVMSAAHSVLKEFGVACAVAVSSAHRCIDRTLSLVREAHADGVKVFIVGAGAAAHLAGVVAAASTRPVIGVPIDATSMKGMDALLATVMMPGGVPVATMAIGRAGAKNAGLLAVSVLALGDDTLAARLTAYRTDMADEVAEKSRRLNRTLQEG